MNDKEKQRADRCVKCSKSTVLGLFGHKELFCPLYNLPCSKIVQCVYVADNQVTHWQPLPEPPKED